MFQVAFLLGKKCVNVFKKKKMLLRMENVIAKQENFEKQSLN